MKKIAKGVVVGTVVGAVMMVTRAMCLPLYILELPFLPLFGGMAGGGIAAIIKKEN